jgi:hypothetical protein
VTHDGDGIESVKFTISDASGEIVHEKVKQNAGYCAFGGGEPDCNVYAPAEHDYRWPNGSAIVNYDHYNVDIVITSQQGQVSTWFWGFKVEVPGYVSPPRPASPASSFKAASTPSLLKPLATRPSFRGSMYTFSSTPCPSSRQVSRAAGRGRSMAEPALSQITRRPSDQKVQRNSASSSPGPIIRWHPTPATASSCPESAAAPQPAPRI